MVETPIHFEDRQFGTSKLTLWQQLLYLQHLRRLYIFKFGVWSQLAQFLTVGALGTVVNLGALTALLALGAPLQASVALAIVVSMVSNFLLNRRFSFGAARTEGMVQQFLRFSAACSMGAAINYAVTLTLTSRLPEVAAQHAALAGIVAATAFNFVASRYLVFRAARIRPSIGTSGTAPHD